MNKLFELRMLLFFLGVLVCNADTFSIAGEPERPNILWITTEDMSPTLGCFGDTFAISPEIDRLSRNSIKYTHAFATAPVCSPTRSCLITGCYATSLGTEQMRSAFPVPDFMKGFPALLRETGYYTTNNFKTDYNTSSADRIIAASWDESSPQAHWRNRPDPKQPFFSIFNLMNSHQSRTMVWSQERFRDEVQSKLSPDQIHDPSTAPVPPYYPDTLVTRRIVARYYDCVTAIDKEVGQILGQLEEDGLAENTIVFFYSDHGSGMPRHKRLLHDSGMHVPLLIHFPKKWAHLAPQTMGTTTDRLVSFVDLPPTVLNLVGIEPPTYMQGQSFLDPNSIEREYVYGHRDRIDEVIDLARSVRSKQYLYIRNYHAHQSWNQFSAYSDLSEIRHEFYRTSELKQASPTQNQYSGPTKPIEELYDCRADPQNLDNLAALPEHAQTLMRLREASQQHNIESGDLGFIPESYAWKLFANSTPWEKSREPGFDEHVNAALAANGRLDNDAGKSIDMLSSHSPSARYWGVIEIASQKAVSQNELKKIRALLTDHSSAVRIEAANILARNGELGLAMPVLTQALESKNLTIALHATRTIELLGTQAVSAIPNMRSIAERSEKLQASDTPAVFSQSGEKDLAMFCGFSANGFLTRIQQGAWENLIGTDAANQWENIEEGVTFPGAGEVTMLSRNKNLWIVHNEEFKDFELIADVRMPNDVYNAGIGFRCTVQKNGRLKGYQCEVAEKETGMLYAIGSGGWVWPKGEQQRQKFFDKVGNAFRRDQWNQIRILCRGDHIQIWVNGIATTDIHEGKHLGGRISLQHHGKGGVHRYRNVYLRPHFVPR